MTTISDLEIRTAPVLDLDERSAHRINGWVIATVASILLWSASGAAVWGFFTIIH